MRNTIRSIDKDSPLRDIARPGDELISVNGRKIIDVLDYKFYAYDAELDVELSSGTVHVSKDEGGDLGLEFEDYLMDAPRSCANNCIFCFIDQLPQGMRSTMYFKDDDARLSFLLGNYITLTNLSEREIQRIVDLHISPVNVSVHTTNPELRCGMLRNPNAGKCLDIMRKFAEGNIVMNCQVVCCPGINDGAELDRTMEELAELYPAVGSVSIVPVGLTRFREGLYELEPFTKESASRTLGQVESFSEKCLEKYGSRIFFCGDELYIKAGKAIPEDSFYEDYPQLENGVGMIRLLETEFTSALKLSDDAPRKASIACGTSVAAYMERLVELAKERFPETDFRVYPVSNDFFGHSVNVSGLITGGDLIAQLKGKDLGEFLLISQNMIRRAERDFLDDVKLTDAERELGVPVHTVEQDGFALYDAMCGIFSEEIERKYGE